MSVPRLADASAALPPEGRVLLVGLGAEAGLFPAERSVAVETDAATHAALAAQGREVATAIPEADFAAAVVGLDRARARSQARIAAAAARLAPGAGLWVDGAKTDGIEPLLKALRPWVAGDVVSRGHGKLARLLVPEGDWLPGDWAARETEAAPGFVTRPGLFSADGIDPGSALLAAALPAKMPSRVVDLGAGWGWLAAQVLARPGVEVVHLVEADAEALDCARANVTDPRARFHWGDATRFRLPEPVNGVVMNPPFHDGRAASPRLGAAFIAAAAGLLTGAGRLWMVANRHLPYEADLAQHFASVAELPGGDGRFKLLTATGAKRRR